MKKIIPFLALTALFGCVNRAEKTLTLDTPTDKQVYRHGETIHFDGELKTTMTVYDEGVLRVYNQKTGKKILEEYFNYDYEYFMLNDFTDTTVLEVRLSLQKEDRDTEDLKKTISITCLPN